MRKIKIEFRGRDELERAVILMFFLLDRFAKEEEVEMWDQEMETDDCRTLKVPPPLVEYIEEVKKAMDKALGPILGQEIYRIKCFLITLRPCVNFGCIDTYRTEVVWVLN